MLTVAENISRLLWLNDVFLKLWSNSTPILSAEEIHAKHSFLLQLDFAHLSPLTSATIWLLEAEEKEWQLQIPSIGFLRPQMQLNLLKFALPRRRSHAAISRSRASSNHGISLSSRVSLRLKSHPRSLTHAPFQWYHFHVSRIFLCHHSVPSD